MKEFSFSRIRFRFHEWRREVCVVGERNESSAPGNPRYLLPTHPLPLSTHDHVNHSRDLIAPLHRTARCSRSRFISRGKRESALIRSNVQRGALIKAIPTRLPFFFFFYHHRRSRSHCALRSLAFFDDSFTTGISRSRNTFTRSKFLIVHVEIGRGEEAKKDRQQASLRQRVAASFIRKRCSLWNRITLYLEYNNPIIIVAE